MADELEVKPLAVIPVNPESLPKKGRGRPKKEGTVAVAKKPSAKKAPKKYSSNEIGQQIYGLHQLLATFSGDQGYAITEDNAQKLGADIHEVAEVYNLWWVLQGGPVVKLAITALAVESPVLMHVITKSRMKKVIKMQRKEGVTNNGADKGATVILRRPAHGDVGVN